MLAILAAIFALAGAPASTPFTCTTGMPTGADGTSYWAAGYTQLEPTPSIQVVGSLGCAALVYASATPTQRAALRKMNPTMNFAWIVGDGLLSDLHEAFHVGLHTTNECRAERAALANLPQLLRSFTVAERAAALAQATKYDAAMPMAYHTGC